MNNQPLSRRGFLGRSGLVVGSIAGSALLASCNSAAKEANEARTSGSGSRNVSLQLGWLIMAYKLFPDKGNFFLAAKKEKLTDTDYFFNKLAGNATLMQQIKQGVPEPTIRKSWEPGLKKFKTIRKKYLLYPDFE